jgi:hypothetical protein
MKLFGGATRRRSNGFIKHRSPEMSTIAVKFYKSPFPHPRTNLTKIVDKNCWSIDTKSWNIDSLEHLGNEE